MVDFFIPPSIIEWAMRNNLKMQKKLFLLFLFISALHVHAKNLPSDVAQFIDRANGCIHLYSIDSSDPEADKQKIETLSRKLGCDKFDREKEEKTLKKKYRKNKKLLRLIESAGKLG